MVTRSVHIYKTVGSLDVKLYVYTKFPDRAAELSPPNLAIFLWFDGRGLAGFNRRLFPAHPDML
jgi:hypothetical protein